MKRLTIVSFIAVFALTLVVAPAMASISMSGDVATWAQSIEADSSATLSNEDQEIGFNDPAANLHIYGDVASGVDAYVELQARTSGANASDMTINEAYITLDELLAAADVKVGQFEVDFGNQHLRRSDVADVQDNPLIGNSLVDPYAVQSGIELSGQADRFAWSGAVTNGANTADFNDGSGIGFVAKVWGDITPALSGALSFYTVSHDSSVSRPSLTTSNLFAAQGGESYQGAGSNLQAANGAGNDVTAWQVDAGYDLSAHDMPASIDAWYGSAENSPVGGGNDTEMDYYGATVTYDLSPQAYFAGRYEIASNESSGTNTQEEAERFQLGVGYELNSSTLAKLEYVDQENESNAPNNSGEEFGGVIGELSVNF